MRIGLNNRPWLEGGEACGRLPNKIAAMNVYAFEDKLGKVGRRNLLYHCCRRGIIFFLSSRATEKLILHFFFFAPLFSFFSPLIRGTKWREKIESFFHFFSQRLIELMKVGSMDENHFRNFVNAKFFSNRLILGERGKKR